MGGGQLVLLCLEVRSGLCKIGLQVRDFLCQPNDHFGQLISLLLVTVDAVAAHGQEGNADDDGDDSAHRDSPFSSG